MHWKKNKYDAQNYYIATQRGIAVDSLSFKTYRRRQTDWREGFAMSSDSKALIERFYYEMWNRADERIAREILHPRFRFRASLGPERHGPDGFIDYMRSVHAALADFTCIIEDLITMADRAAA